jgi:demethylmenaquinone methyltransferase/2-methoxy-6-polyprenyl-1,4-benzoquinol methylase
VDHGEHEAAMRAYYGARAPLMRYADPSARVANVLEQYATFIGGKLQGRRVLEVACGTGFWTQKLADHAERVWAIDAVAAMLAEARARRYPRANVEIAFADAFTLDGVPDGWDGGFHFQWFSHVPRSRIPEFLSAFHRKLKPDAVVVFGDNNDRGTDPDAEGNLYQDRVLPDGGRYRIIKNWPDEAELRQVLRPHATAVEYRSFEHDWFVSYRAR